MRKNEGRENGNKEKEPFNQEKKEDQIKARSGGLIIKVHMYFGTTTTTAITKH
jgi:hypothetical protein